MCPPQHTHTGPVQWAPYDMLHDGNTRKYVYVCPRSCRLVRRALFVAELRDRQVEMVKEAKAAKQEALKKLIMYVQSRA